MSARLSLANVEVRRGERVVLSVPELAVAPGESLAILGPNGAGKSTLLGVAAGLDLPARGEARVDGEPARAIRSRRRVALLPQDAPMLAGSVESNVALPLKLRGVPRHERLTRARLLLESFGLAALGPRDARHLSGGEARRVALARALVAAPEALLLDEPFTGVDGPAREALLADVRTRVRAAGITLLVVTQSREEALRLGTRVAVLWNGRVAQDGAPDQVFARPVSAEIARFVGVENVLRGRVVEAEPDRVVVAIGETRVTGVPSAPIANGESAWVMVSPDHVELRTAPEHAPGSVRNVLPARVVSVEPREGRVHVLLDAGFPLIAAVTRAAAADLALGPGVPVAAAFKAMACHVVAAGPESK